MGILDKVAEIALGATLVLALGACTVTPWRTAADNSETEPAEDTTVTAAAVPPPAVAVTSSDVPSGFYRVKPGDTLTAVAKAHGQRPADLAALNKLPADARIQVGQLLRVSPSAPASPKAAAASPPAAPTVAAASTPAAAATSREATAPHSNSRFVWPIEGRVAQPFKAKSKGVVIAGPAGQQVKAAASGRVVYAGDGMKAYGNLVILKHDTHLITAYGQNSKLLVKEGEVVKQGQVIAMSGTNGAGNASLVFEVRDDGKPVDPLGLLPNAQP
jgi:lipoprotein NlpD